MTEIFLRAGPRYYFAHSDQWVCLPVFTKSIFKLIFRQPIIPTKTVFCWNFNGYCPEANWTGSSLFLQPTSSTGHCSETLTIAKPSHVGTWAIKLTHCWVCRNAQPSHVGIMVMCHVGLQENRAVLSSINKTINVHYRGHYYDNPLVRRPIGYFSVIPPPHQKIRKTVEIVPEKMMKSSIEILQILVLSKYN